MLEQTYKVYSSLSLVHQPLQQFKVEDIVKNCVNVKTVESNLSQFFFSIVFNGSTEHH